MIGKFFDWLYQGLAILAIAICMAVVLVIMVIPLAVVSVFYKIFNKDPYNCKEFVP